MGPTGGLRVVLYGLCVLSLASMPGVPGIFDLVSSWTGSDMWALIALALAFFVAIAALWITVLRRRRRSPTLRLAAADWWALGWLGLVFIGTLGVLGFTAILWQDLSKPGAYSF